MKENYTDKNTGISYTLKGDYYIPNLYSKEEEKIILNKYGRARLRFLKEHKKAEYTIMFIDGPNECKVNLPEDIQYYQYTCIDEATRERFLYWYPEHTPMSTVDFVKRCIKY